MACFSTKRAGNSCREIVPSVPRERSRRSPSCGARFGEARLADRLQEGAGGSESEQETSPGRFHRLRLVRLVRQAGEGSLLETGVRGICEEEPGLARNRFSASETANRSREGPEQSVAGKVRNRGLSDDYRSR